MALQWLELKKLLTTLGIMSLCFFIVPIPISKHGTADVEDQFQSFILKYAKPYNTSSAGYSKLFYNFQESLKHIKKLNKERTSESSALYGLTEYCDLSPEEFTNQYLQPALHKHINRSQNQHFHHLHHHKKIVKRAFRNIPMKVDWRDKKAVTAVRNQKTCGACWAFSTVETIESMNAIKTGQLLALSVQEAVDCAGNGNLGCAGGDMCSLVEWLVANKIGLELESQYPLHWETETCKLHGKGSGVYVAGNYLCDNFVGTEEQLLSLLAYHGPVAVAVNALAWQYYLGGVIHFHCESNLLNHAVQIVGYDLTAAIPYYIVRNSWGPDFGKSGYLYLGIGSNICGVATEVVSLDIQ